MAFATWNPRRFERHLGALKAARLEDGPGFDVGVALQAILQPNSVPEVVQLIGALVFGAICGLFTAVVA